MNNKLTVVDFSGDESRHEDTLAFLDQIKARAVDSKAVFALVILIGADESVLDGWTQRGGRPFSIVGAIEVAKERFMRENLER